MSLRATLKRLRSSSPSRFWWMMLSLLLTVILIVLLFTRGDGAEASQPAAGKRPSLAAAREAVPPRAKSRANEKPRPTPAPTLSWQAYNILAVEPTRPALPSFDGWLTSQTDGLNIPIKLKNAVVQAAA